MAQAAGTVGKQRRPTPVRVVRRPRGVRYGTLGVLAVLCLGVLQRIDVALEAAHGPGRLSGGVGRIASPARITSPEVSLQVVQGWDTFTRGVSRTPDDLTLLYLVVDLVLILTVARLLRLLQRRALRQTYHLAGVDQQARHAARDAAVRGSAVATVLYVVADLVETVNATRSWHHLSHLFAQLIGWASLVKWLALLLAVLPLLVAELQRRTATPAAAPAGAPPDLPPPPPPVPGVTGMLRATRGQVLILALLVLVLLSLQGELGLQIDDVLIRAAEKGWPALTAVLAAGLTGWILAVGGWWCLRAQLDEPGVQPLGGRRLVLLTLAGGLLLAVGYVSPRRTTLADYAGTFHTVMLLGGALLLFVATSWPKAVRELGAGLPATAPATEADAQRLRHRARPLLAAFAAAPVVVLGLAVARTCTSLWAAGEPVAGPLGWAAGCLATGMGLFLLVWGRVPGLALQGPPVALVMHVLLDCVVLLGAAMLVPLTWVTVIGATAAVMLFGALVSAFVSTVVVLGDRVPVRGSLAVLRLRRVPFLTLLVLLGIGASLVDRDGLYYEVTRSTDLVAEDGQIDREASGVATEWLQAYASPASVTGSAATTGRAQVPMVFVAAAGGGIKAAYWTAASWSCVLGTTCGLGPDRTGQVFLASGTSGGSLGLATVQARLREQLAGSTGPGGSAGPDGRLLTDDRPAGAWYDAALDDDFVAPSVAAFLFRDLPNAVVRLPWPDRNRAAALQQAWEAGVPGLGRRFFLPPSEGAGTWPVLALTGTSAEDGCRLSVSTLRLDGRPLSDPGVRCGGDPASADPRSGAQAHTVRDASDFLCSRLDPPLGGSSTRTPHNLPLSAAVLLSARFPYVSPSGDLTSCAGDGHTYALDGGLVDNTGGAAVAQVWQQVEDTVREHNQRGTGACVVPRLLVLDNHYDPQAAVELAHRPQQLTAPAAGAAASYDLRSQQALGQAMELIRAGAQDAVRDCGLDGETAAALRTQPPVVVIHPVQQPGSRAPLGWTLSERSRRDMSAQVGDPDDATGCRNLVLGAQVRRWFDPHPGPGEVVAAPCRAIQ